MLKKNIVFFALFSLISFNIHAGLWKTLTTFFTSEKKKQTQTNLTVSLDESIEFDDQKEKDTLYDEWVLIPKKENNVKKYGQFTINDDHFSIDKPKDKKEIKKNIKSLEINKKKSKKEMKEIIKDLEIGDKNGKMLLTSLYIQNDSKEEEEEDNEKSNKINVEINADSNLNRKNLQKFIGRFVKNNKDLLLNQKNNNFLIKPPKNFFLNNSQTESSKTKQYSQNYKSSLAKINIIKSSLIMRKNTPKKPEKEIQTFKQVPNIPVIDTIKPQKKTVPQYTVLKNKHFFRKQNQKKTPKRKRRKRKGKLIFTVSGFNQRLMQDKQL